MHIHALSLHARNQSCIYMHTIIHVPPFSDRTSCRQRGARESSDGSMHILSCRHACRAFRQGRQARQTGKADMQACRQACKAVHALHGAMHNRQLANAACSRLLTYIYNGMARGSGLGTVRSPKVWVHSVLNQLFVVIVRATQEPQEPKEDGVHDETEEVMGRLRGTEALSEAMHSAGSRAPIAQQHCIVAAEGCDVRLHRGEVVRGHATAAGANAAACGSGVTASHKEVVGRAGAQNSPTTIHGGAAAGRTRARI